VQRIFDTTRMVLATADAEGITTAEAAERMAERRMDELARVHQIRTFG
jgi:valine dehydrogenase (NAD+)